MGKLPAGRRLECIDTLMENNVAFPVEFKKELFLTRCKEMAEDKTEDFCDALLSGIGDSVAFDPRQPTLFTVGLAAVDLAETLLKVAVQDKIISLLYKGADAANLLLKHCKCLHARIVAILASCKLNPIILSGLQELQKACLYVIALQSLMLAPKEQSSSMWMPFGKRLEGRVFT